MPRVGIKGYIASGVQYAMGPNRENIPVPGIPILDWVFAQLENVLAGQLDSTNLASGGVATANLADQSVTAAKIALGTITPAQTADTVGQTYSGTYTGDGLTASRVIALPFTPRWVQIFPTTGTFVEHIAHAIGAATYFFERDNTGAIVTSAANFQGIVANGVKLGTSATGTTNTAAVVYSLAAWK